MGFTGPVPARSGDLSRDRDANKSPRGDIRQGDMRPVEFFDCPDEWHPTCQRIWHSVPKSGIWEFYQESDLAFLYSILEDLSAAKLNGRGGVPPAMLLTAVYAQLNNFGFSEGDRRKMRIELEAPTEVTTSVEDQAIESYAEQLNVVSIDRTKRKGDK